MEQVVENGRKTSGVLGNEVTIQPRHSTEEIKKAASSFGKGTSNYEGLPPKYIAIMSDQLVESLATLLHAVEYAGKYPKEIEEIFVKLIPNKDGTTRPIVLFRSLARLMWKAMKPAVAKWET